MCVHVSVFRLFVRGIVSMERVILLAALSSAGCRDPPCLIIGARACWACRLWRAGCYLLQLAA